MDMQEKEKTFPYRMRFWGIDLLPHLVGAFYTVLRVAAWLFTLGALANVGNEYAARELADLLAVYGESTSCAPGPTSATTKQS